MFSIVLLRDTYLTSVTFMYSGTCGKKFDTCKINSDLIIVVFKTTYQTLDFAFYISGSICFKESLFKTKTSLILDL